MKESFLNELRRLNIERQKEWDPENKATLSFKGLEFAGEAGELASKIKKLARKTEFDFVGSDYDMTDIEEEVGDVLITLDLVCQKMGIDIEKVTKNKFNATSEKVGMKTKFEPDVIYIEIKDNEEISFDRRLKDHIAKVNLLKPHLAISSNSEESLIYAEEHLTYAQLLPIYQKHYGYDNDPERFTLIDKKDITVPKKYRTFRQNIILEPYNHGLEDNLYCVQWGSKKVHVYADHGENAKNYVAYTKIPMRYVDQFNADARYFVTQSFLLN
jgi:NTP pyrophosphatase (non-canonical NTP hydrolase)